MLPQGRTEIASAQSKLQLLEASLPSEFDEAIYRGIHPDLKQMDRATLWSHYERHGKREGRRSHELEHRKQFASLIPAGVDVLEIGPFHDPMLTGPGVRYFDVIDKAGLAARAKKVGYATDRIPEVHFVSANGDLSIVAPHSCDAVLSSHVIEHQPDLIGHLRAVERLLREDGLYFLLVPDKRYCFDHFMAETTIADLLEAHQARRKVHSLKSVVADAALTTHNDPKRHWQGDHGSLPHVTERTRGALTAFQESGGKYLDVHAWYFSPASFREALALAFDLEQTNLTLSRIYPTLHGSNEFWAVLRAVSR